MSQGYAPGVQRYVEQAREAMAHRKELRDEVRKLKFDTIAVHGMYTVEEAFERGQGGIIEPIFPSTSQAYRDSDEMEAGARLPDPHLVLLAHPQPDHLLPGGDPVAARGLRLRLRRLGAGTSSGMSAIKQAVEPLLAPSRRARASDQLRLLRPGLRRHLPALQPAHGASAAPRCAG